MKNKSVLLGSFAFAFISTNFAFASNRSCVGLFSDSWSSRVLEDYNQTHHDHLEGLKRLSEPLSKAIETNPGAQFEEILSIYLSRIKLAEGDSAQQKKSDAYYGISALSLFGFDTGFGLQRVSVPPASDRSRKMLRVLALKGRLGSLTAQQIYQILAVQQAEIELDSSKESSKSLNLAARRLLSDNFPDKDPTLSENDIFDLMAEADRMVNGRPSGPVRPIKRIYILDNLLRGNERNHFELLVRALLDRYYSDSSAERKKATELALGLLSELGQDKSVSRYVTPPEKMGPLSKALFHKVLYPKDQSELLDQIKILDKALDIRHAQVAQLPTDPDQIPSIETCVKRALKVLFE